ncbi:Transposon Tf2-9 polyprotein [Labeo rohita]|uniref:ribonuclease H n=1 Tax=Labeo rohita TaxID=84645 RepID=A0ABQ8MKQ4_LABRO|nr:Transposon Tf2-9 polyprotein [Labeo rohita]
MSTVPASSAPVLRQKVLNLLAKRMIEVVPPSERESVFYNRYFVVPKKGGGLRPILDLRPINCALYKHTFKMTTLKQILGQIQPGDWFVSVDLKDAYALSPLRVRGIYVFNYLDDWLILAHSEDVLNSHKCVLLHHLLSLGLCVNVQKSALCPSRSITYLGVHMERIRDLMSALDTFSLGRPIALKEYQRLLGRMAAAAIVCHLGLLYMRPLQIWLTTQVPKRAWRTGRARIVVTRKCLITLEPWRDPDLYRRGVQLGLVTRRKVVTTDGGLGSSLWGAHRPLDRVGENMAHKSPRAESGLLSPSELHHAGHHVLIRMHNMSVVLYINRKGGVRSRALYEQAARLLLWADCHLLFIRAAHVPGCLNSGADMLSRSGIPHGEWRLQDGGTDLASVREEGGGFDCDGGERGLPSVLLSVSLPSGRGHAHNAVAESPSVCIPPVKDFAASAALTQGGESVGAVNRPVLAKQTVVTRSAGTTSSSPVADPAETGPPVSGGRLNMAPEPRMVETSCVVGVQEPAVFMKWCRLNGHDLENCPVSDILEFLQQRMDGSSMPSTLKVYVAAILAFHATVDGHSVGKHDLVTRFLRGARRLRPPRPPTAPPWDLALVLEALARPPFEPLQSVGLKELSFKATLLLALASVKRIGDLLSVNADCMQFGPGDYNVTLKPRSGYVPKSLSTPFRAQVITLPAFTPELAATPLLIACCAQCGLYAVTLTACLTFVSLSNCLYALEGAPKGGPSPNSGFRIGWSMQLLWLTVAREWNALLVSEAIQKGRLPLPGPGPRGFLSEISAWGLDADWLCGWFRLGGGVIAVPRLRCSPYY